MPRVIYFLLGLSLMNLVIAIDFNSKFAAGLAIFNAASAGILITITPTKPEDEEENEDA